MKKCLHSRPEMKKKTRLALGVATLAGTLCASYVFAADANGSSGSMPPTVKALIAKNCAVCHHPPNPPLGIDLTALTFNLSDVETFGRWVRVHDAVRNGKMPPGGGNALKEADRAAFVNAIAQPLVAYEHLRGATDGRAVLRRLNRYEYENSVRDLL